MKLHLPKLLTVALLAAFTTVGFTLPQAQAKVSTLTAENAAGWATLDEEKGWEYSSSFSGDLTTSTSFQILRGDTPIAFTADGTSSGYGTYTFAVTLDLAKLNVSSDTILLRGGGLAGIGVQQSTKKLTETWTASKPTWGVQDYVLPSEGIITIVHTSGSSGGYVAVYDEAGTTVNFERHGDGGLRGSKDLVQTFYASQSLIDAATAIAVWETTGTMDDTEMQNAAKAMPQFPVASLDFTWNGKTEGAAWDITSTVWLRDGKVDQYVSSESSTVTFGSGADLVKEVAVNGTIVAGTMNVNDNYTFTVGSEKSLTIGTLSVAAEKRATIAGDGTVGGSITKVGAGTLDVNAAVNMDSLLVQAGDVNIDGKNGTISSLKAANGATVTLTNVTATSINQEGRGDGGYVGNLIIGNGAVVKASRTDGWGFERNNTLTVATGGQLDMQGFRWTFQSKNTIVLDGGEIKGNGDSTYGAIDFDGKGNKVKVTKDSTFSARVRMRNGDEVTFDVDEDKNLAFTGEIVNQGNGTLIKAGKGTLTMSGAINNAGSYQLNEGTLAIGTTVNMGDRFTQTGGQLSVLANGNLTLNGGSLTAAITNAGTLTFGGNITATGFEVTAGGENYTDVEGNVTDDGNGFKGSTGSSITIVNNSGTIVNGGSYTVTQDEVAYTIQTDGTATSEGGSTNYSVYYQKSGEVDVSQILEASAGAIPPCTSISVSDTGVLNVDDQFGFINATGGEVIFSQGGEVDMLFVTGNAKVSGLTDYSTMMISAGKTATMEEGITSGNVEFSSADGNVDVTNTGEDEILYSTDEAAAKVTADTMTVGNSDTQTIINNSLVLDEIVNNNAEGLLLQGNVEDDVTLRAIGGDIVLAGQKSNTVSVVDLEIAADKMVMMPNGDDEGTITVTDTLTGGDATLLANLTLVDGTTLDVNGGGTHALTLGSELTINLTNGGLVNLDDDTLLALNNLGDGETLNLIVSVDSVLDALTYGADYDGMGYDELFSRIGGQLPELQGNYTVYAKGDAFGVTKQSAVPEPTTGTLSLLALMALAARRRRK